MSDDLIGGDTARDRIERLLRGEEIARVVAADAGRIPAYYGVGATASDVARIWLRMWRNMAMEGRLRPGDEEFYRSNAIAWASRR